MAHDWCRAFCCILTGPAEFKFSFPKGNPFFMALFRGTCKKVVRNPKWLVCNLWVLCGNPLKGACIWVDANHSKERLVCCFQGIAKQHPFQRTLHTIPMWLQATPVEACRSQVQRHFCYRLNEIFYSALLQHTSNHHLKRMELERQEMNFKN